MAATTPSPRGAKIVSRPHRKVGRGQGSREFLGTG
jgi:hypothetical protein